MGNPMSLLLINYDSSSREALRAPSDLQIYISNEPPGLLNLYLDLTRVIFLVVLIILCELH